MKLGRVFIGQVMAEFLSSLLFMAIGCTGLINAGEMLNNHLRMSMNVGLAYFSTMQFAYYISGGFINPCVTIAAMILQKIEIVPGVIYIVTQFLGSLLGMGISWLLEPDVYFLGPVCLTTPRNNTTDVQAVFIEMALTAAWMYTMCAVWDSRTQINYESMTLRIGLVVTALILIGDIFTGGSMNPARSLAPAIIHGKYEKIWIYFAGPLPAAILVPLAWRFAYKGGAARPEAE